jgi:hypothetical protein
MQGSTQEAPSQAAVAETVQKLGEDTVKLLEEVRESLRDSLEQVEWRWHHIENRLAELKTELRGPTEDVSRAAVRFGAELRQSSVEVLGALKVLAGR